MAKWNTLLKLTTEIQKNVEFFRISRGYETTSEALRELIKKALRQEGYVFYDNERIVRGRPSLQMYDLKKPAPPE